MKMDPQFSHDGMSDRLTHCAAPPLFYSHLDRMISGSMRSGAPLTLASISIPIFSSLDQILAIAHVINQMMRKEDHQLEGPNFFGVVTDKGGKLRPVIQTTVPSAQALPAPDAACKLPA